MEQKKHIGKRTRVKYIGGDYHGEEKQVRAPMADTVEVAQAPKYIGKGNYDPNVIGYQQYVKRIIGDQIYYVWKPWLDDFDINRDEVLLREYESENNKAIRLEKEAEERMRKLMKDDFNAWGFAITVNGKRVHPGEVKLYINTKYKHYDQMFIGREKLFEGKDDSP
jgi:hypothetical protein